MKKPAKTHFYIYSESGNHVSPTIRNLRGGGGGWRDDGWMDEGWGGHVTGHAYKICKNGTISCDYLGENLSTPTYLFGEGVILQDRIRVEGMRDHNNKKTINLIKQNYNNINICDIKPDSLK